MPIKGLIFDAYGTLYDVHSVHTKTEELCPNKGDLITQIWRLKQLEYTWLQTALRDYRDFGFLTESWFSLCAGPGSSQANALSSRFSANILISILFPKPRKRSARSSAAAVINWQFCQTAAPPCSPLWPRIPALMRFSTRPLASMTRANSNRIRNVMR